MSPAGDPASEWWISATSAQGAGGVSATARATGLSRRTIQRGLRELDESSDPGPRRVRRAGAGRKPLTEIDPELLEHLDRLLEAAVRGDPQRSLRRTSKSAAKLAGGTDLVTVAELAGHSRVETTRWFRVRTIDAQLNTA